MKKIALTNKEKYKIKKSYYNLASKERGEILRTFPYLFAPGNITPAIVIQQYPTITFSSGLSASYDGSGSFYQGYITGNSILTVPYIITFQTPTANSASNVFSGPGVTNLTSSMTAVGDSGAGWNDTYAIMYQNNGSSSFIKGTTNNVNTFNANQGVDWMTSQSICCTFREFVKGTLEYKFTDINGVQTGAPWQQGWNTITGAFSTNLNAIRRLVFITGATPVHFGVTLVATPANLLV